MSAPVLCLGHSHLVALRAGYLWHVRHDGADRDAWQFVLMNEPPHVLRMRRGADGASELDPPLVAAMTGLLDRLRPRAVVLLLTGNEHNIMGLFQPPGSPAPPDVDWPASGLPLAEGCDRLPADLVLAELEHQLERGNFPFSRWIAGQVDVPLVVVAPPPPITDAAHVRAHPGIFADRIAGLDLAPAAFRHKLWRMDGWLRRRLAAGIGARFVDAPAAALDGPGLGAAFRSPDPTHGNQDYGRLLLADVMAALDTTPTETCA